jgi:hypothetical protein
MKEARHVLQMSCGLTVELLLDEKTGQALCIWSERPTWEVLPTLLREYPRWRDEILEAWALRRGNISALVPTPKVVIGSNSRSKSTSKRKETIFQGAARFHMLSQRRAADLQRLQELNAANEAELRKLETAGAR